MKRTSARTRFSARSRHELARNIAERSSVRPNIRTSKTEFNFSRNVFGPKSVVADGIRSAWRILFAIVRVKELSGQYSEVQSCSLVTFAFFSRHTRGLFAAGISSAPWRKSGITLRHLRTTGADLST